MPTDSPNNNNRGTLASLLQVLDRPGPLVILPHDNPDPDALASAAALKYLVGELLRKEAHIALGGIVGRAENRAMLTYLNITLVPVSEVHFGGETQVALVDTQPGRRRSRTHACRASTSASFARRSTAPSSTTASWCRCSATCGTPTWWRRWRTSSSGSTR